MLKTLKLLKINNCYCFMFIFFVHIYIYIYIYIFIYIHVTTWAILKEMRQISWKRLFRLASSVIYFDLHILKMSPLSFFFCDNSCAQHFSLWNALIITSRTKKHVVGSKENKRHDLGLNLSKHKLNNTLHQIKCLYKHS